MNITIKEQSGSHEWIERTLSTGVKLCVQSLAKLMVSNSESFMFTVPIEEVRQVTVYPRINKTGLWNVDISYRAAHFAFECTSDDLADVKYIFSGRPIVDMAVQLGLAPGL